MARTEFPPQDAATAKPDSGAVARSPRSSAPVRSSTPTGPPSSRPRARLTYGELDERTDRIAAGLLQRRSATRRPGAAPGHEPTRVGRRVVRLAQSRAGPGGHARAAPRARDRRDQPPVRGPRPPGRSPGCRSTWSRSAGPSRTGHAAPPSSTCSSRDALDELGAGPVRPDEARTSVDEAQPRSVPTTSRCSSSPAAPPGAEAHPPPARRVLVQRRGLRRAARLDAPRPASRT